MPLRLSVWTGQWNGLPGSSGQARGQAEPGNDEKGEAERSRRARRAESLKRKDEGGKEEEGEERGRRERKERRGRLLGDLGDAAGDRVHLHQAFDAVALFLELGELAAGEL